jgi:MFS family permease
VPLAKARAGLEDGALGLLLLCLGAGSIVAMPVAGALAARFGCRRVLLASAGLVCLALPALATASGLPLLVAALLVFGAGLGALDCVVNIQAVIVERAAGRAMMSGFHGLFSVGGIAAAAGVSALLGAGVSPAGAARCVVAGVAAAMRPPPRTSCPAAARAAGRRRPSPSRAASCCSSAPSASSSSWPRAPCSTGAPCS